MRRWMLIAIYAIVPVTIVAAGPPKAVKRAIEARLIGRTLTLTTPLYRYAGSDSVTTIHPTRGLFYAGFGEADRDPQQLALKIQAVQDRARATVDSIATAVGGDRPSDAPILASMTKTDTGSTVKLTKLHWLGRGPVLLIEARDDLNMETGFKVAWNTEDWPKDPSLAESIAQLITTHLGRLE